MAEVGLTLRLEVRARAKQLCEYCRLPERLTLVTHEIDHIIAAKHGGAALSENLALCCVLCNRHKGTDLASIDPFTGLVEHLFNQRANLWADHFEVNGAHIVGLTPAGRATARLLEFNRPERLSERQLIIQAGFLFL